MLSLEGLLRHLNISLLQSHHGHCAIQSIISKMSKNGSDKKEAGRPPAPTGGSPVTPFPAVQPSPLTLRTVPLPNLQARLWNEAYDSLRKDEPKLVDAYERIISSKLKSTDQATNLPNSVERADTSNAIYQDQERRCQQMQIFIEHELNQTATSTASSRKTSRSLHVMGALREAVGTALHTVPQGAVAWAAVVMGLDVC